MAGGLEWNLSDMSVADNSPERASISTMVRRVGSAIAVNTSMASSYGSFII